VTTPTANQFSGHIQEIFHYVQVSDFTSWYNLGCLLGCSQTSNHTHPMQSIFAINRNDIVVNIFSSEW
jgi:hypothetical protein